MLWPRKQTNFQKKKIIFFCKKKPVSLSVMQGRMTSIARSAAAASKQQQKRFFMSKFYDIFVNVSPSAIPIFTAGGSGCDEVH